MGGFNDTLCQIEKAWRYADRHDRTLLVDSRFSGLLDDFGRYFRLLDADSRTQLSFDVERMRFIESLAIVPRCLHGRVNTYATTWDPSFKNFSDKDTGELLTFDFDANYDEDLLVHHQCWGGVDSIECLARLTLCDELRTEFTARLSSLGDDYVGVHVRNTDYRTDYRTFFASIHDDLIQKIVVVCSDDYTCREYGKRFFEKSTVVTLSDVPDTKGWPLHANTGLDRYHTNTNMLLDLLALAGAARLYFTDHDLGFPSGFSVLAQLLNARRAVLAGLLRG